MVKERLTSFFVFFLTERSSYILERHHLARVDVCLFLSYTPWRKLVHPSTCADYQLRDGVIVIAVAVQLGRGALFDVRRWRRVCYFCGGDCAEWKRGYGFGLGCSHAVAVLARKPLRGSHRWWCILLCSNSTVAVSAAT
jgi:hypothetical protein